MARSKGLLVTFLIIAGITVLLMLTYSVPIFLIRTTERSTGSNEQPVVSMAATPTVDESQSDPAGPVIVIQPFQRVVTSEAKRELEIKADRATIDQKSRMFHLQKVNEIAFWGEDSEKVTIEADSGVWDQQRNVVRVQDDVKALIEIPGREPVEVISQWLQYDNELAHLVGGDQITIIHGPYTASGKRLRLRPQINHIELEDSVRVTIQPEAFKDQTFFVEPVTIECGLLQYGRKAQVLQFDIDPIVTTGKSTLTATKISLFSEVGNMRIIWSGGCVFTIHLPDHELPVTIQAREITFDQNAGTLILKQAISIEHGDRSIRAAEHLSVMLDPQTEDILGGQATGKVIFQDVDVSGSADAISWNTLNNTVILNGHAELENRKDVRVSADRIHLQIGQLFYSAEGQVRFEIAGDQPRSGNEPQGSFLFGGFAPEHAGQTDTLVLNADLVEVNEDLGHMHFMQNVHGSRGTATFSMDTLDIQFDPETRRMKDMTARGLVTLSDQDRMLTGNYLYYNEVTGDVQVRETPVLWQGDTQIRADRFDYNELDKILRMSGHVEALTIIDNSFSIGPDPSGSAGSKDRQMRLTAENGIYNEMTGSLEFQDDVVMRQSVWTIFSESMQLQFDTDSGELAGADALGGVRITHPLFEATGHSLTYSPETSILILRGTDTRKCRVIQGERGSEGDEVRFFINENRFVIEKGTSMILPSEIVETVE